MDPSSPTFEPMPQEVLEQIAFHTACQGFLGPPSSLASFLQCNRSINSRLSITRNTHLYAQILANKFDTTEEERNLNPYVLAEELKRCCLLLTRLRSGSYDSHREALAHCYYLMLRSKGKNEKQLREYARADVWLKDLWLSRAESDAALCNIFTNTWPLQTSESSLAMWLFWFFYKPDLYDRKEHITWQLLDILKIYALGAPRYQLTSRPWHQFRPQPETMPYLPRVIVQSYSQSVEIYPPPIAVPAILSFIALYGHLHDQPSAIPLSSYSPEGNGESEWEFEQRRCRNPSVRNSDLEKSFLPGSVEGIWEGLFTYMEFTTYASLLSSKATPSILQGSLVVRHRQTWKLREHHSAEEPEMSGGDPLRAYLPNDIQIRETQAGLEIKDDEGVRSYRRPGGIEPGQCVKDIIITGEGHSSWGQFSLIGRVRPSDGFICLLKQYDDGDRGQWIYRGYIVGKANPSLVGRWRDTISPVVSHGYEGCFMMSRRR